ncbi:hypothetical protein J6590_090248 [Homalodisca vitripennis]|nr:hypothetical protein J6590_090248 [Homalodisca vitripennis]
MTYKVSPREFCLWRPSSARVNYDGEFCSSQPPSLAVYDVPRVCDFIGYPISKDKDYDVFWVSNSTEQDVQLAVGKTVSWKVYSVKIDCLTLTLVPAT